MAQNNIDPSFNTTITRTKSENINIENHLKSPTLMMLVLISTLGAILYGSFLLNPDNRGDILPFALVILAETFLLCQALVSLWTILASGYDPRSFHFHRDQDNLFSLNGMVNIKTILNHNPNKPSSHPLYLNGKRVRVDAFITVYGEDLDVIRQTAIATRDLVGLHSTTILDDGKSEEVRQLAKQLRVDYIRRDTNEGAKAGNINNALKMTKGDYFIVFDADFVPDKMFIYETLPFFEDEKVAFVQTPQHYDNMNNLISKGAGFMQHVFYSLVQPGKNRFNAAFCVGTNVIFRRSSIIDIGGIYQYSKSEDIWTSLLLHEKGYKSVYIPNVLAIGKTPETVKTFSLQQLRWATGGFEILLRHNPLFSKKLNIDQKLQYFSTVTYYFGGLAALCLLLLPPLQIYFNLTPVNLDISPITWALYYSGFYVMQIVVAFYTMGGFKLETLMLANASFPIYLRAFKNALFRRDQAWSVTGRADNYDSPYNYIIPQTMIMVFLVLTSFVGIWKGWYTQDYSVSVLWNIVNSIVFTSFFLTARRESKRFKKASRLKKRANRSAIIKRERQIV